MEIRINYINLFIFLFSLSIQLFSQTRTEVSLNGNNLHTYFTNYGIIGKVGSDKSFEWPINSSHSYTNEFGFVIGGEVIDNSGNIVHIITESFSNRGDYPNSWEPIQDNWNPTLSDAALEYHFVMDDRNNAEFDYYPMENNNTIQGLGLKIYQSAYQWNNEESKDFIIIRYLIKNYSDKTLNKLVVGFYGDVHIGGSSDYNDDISSYSINENSIFCWDYDGIGEGGFNPGYFGIKVLESPKNVGLTSFSTPIYASVFPNNDEELFQLLIPNTFTVDYRPGDYVILLGSGYFSLSPGEETIYAVSFVMGANKSDFTNHAEIAEEYYKRIPKNKSSTTNIDLSMDRIEVNQAIINGDLVENKKTCVRIYISSNQNENNIDGVSATLFVDGQTYLPENADRFFVKNAYNESEQSNLDNSLNFFIENISAMNHYFNAELIIPEYINDTNPKNNQIMDIQHTFQSTKRINVLYSPIKWDNRVVKVVDMESAAQFLNKIYPIAYNNVELIPISETPHNYDEITNDLLNELELKKINYNKDHDPDVDLIIGFTPFPFLYQLDDFEGKMGKMYYREGVGLVEDAEEIPFAHELGHYYLYGGNELHNSLSIGEGGLDVIEGNSIPSGFQDLMASPYSLYTWIASSTFNLLFASLSTNGFLEKSIVNFNNKIFIISGTISKTEKVTLNPINTIEGSLDISVSEPNGEFSIICLNASEQEVIVHKFNLSYIDQVSGTDLEEERFLFLLPFSDEVSILHIQHNDVTLHTQYVSDSEPFVKISYPNGGESLSDNEIISWSGSDLDNDTLSYSIYYSSDGDKWSLLTSNISDTFYNFNSSFLPGSDSAYIKVVVSDGFNNSHDLSDYPFSIAKKAPIAIITEPKNDSLFVYREKILFSGKGIDFEDGNLPDKSLLWVSSLDGIIGYGESLQKNLTSGKHLITLHVTDSDNLTSIDTLRLEISFDSDGDKMPDDWENMFTGLNVYVDDANLDIDEDDLVNVDEYYFGVDPTIKDSDGDGYLDGYEVRKGSDPSDPNSIPTTISSNRLIKPTKYILYQNYPNPFNPVTTIRYQLPKASFVKIEVFNSLGQKIQTLLNTKQSQGIHSVFWDGKNENSQRVSSGVYFYRLVTDSFIQARKMILIR